MVVGAMPAVFVALVPLGASFHFIQSTCALRNYCDKIQFGFVETLAA